MRKITLVCSLLLISGCAGRTPAPVQTVQIQDPVMGCDAINAEMNTNTQRLAALGSEQGAKVAQNVAAGIAGVFIPVLWFAMDFQGAAGIEERALQGRNQYLATMAMQRCAPNRPVGSAPAPAPAPSYVPAAYAPAPAPAPAPAAGAPVSSTGRASASTIGFACPPAGTTWILNDATLRSESADPSDPTMCIRTSRGNTTRLLYNYYASSSLSDNDIRSGMARLYPLAIGNSTEFFYLATSSRSSSTYQYQDSFRVLRVDVLQIGSEQRGTWVLERRSIGQAGNNFNGIETLWFDQQSGITLKREIGSTTGTTANRSFTVSQVNSSP